MTVQSAAASSSSSASPHHPQLKRAPGHVTDPDDGLVRAVFSTFDVVDADGDLVTRGAFDDGAPVRIGAFGHRSWHGALPLGKGRIRTTARAAVLEGRFFLDVPLAQDTFRTVKGLGELAEWSFSLEDVKATREMRGDQVVRVIEAVTVHEVCPVLKGAGVNTRTECAGASCRVEKAHIDHTLRSVELDRNVHEAWARETFAPLRNEARKFYTYEPVPAHSVPSWKRDQADQAVADAAADLGIHPPTVVWCRHAPGAKGQVIAHHRPLWGKHLPDAHQVWLTVDAPDPAATARHEVRHLTQPKGMPTAAMEADADAYARSRS